MISTIYISGIISSFIIVSPATISLDNKGITIWGIMQTFSLNYWYIILIWLFGLSMIGYLFTLFIIYFRGFTFGILILFLGKINFSYLLLLSLVEIVIFIPMFFVLTYQAIMISYNKQNYNHLTMDNYNKLLVVITIGIFLYSIIIEIIGGIYG
jgi:hypothetical protein